MPSDKLCRDLKFGRRWTQFTGAYIIPFVLGTVVSNIVQSRLPLLPLCPTFRNGNKQTESPFRVKPEPCALTSSGMSTYKLIQVSQ